MYDKMLCVYYYGRYHEKAPVISNSIRTSGVTVLVPYPYRPGRPLIFSKHNLSTVIVLYIP